MPATSSSSNATPGGTLRAVTYLAPGLPLELFELLLGHLEGDLGCRFELHTEERHSGPMHGDHDPFAEGEADLGFLCSPSFLYLRDKPAPSVELVPAGLVFADPRNRGEATYFSDVVVRRDHPAASFADLCGGVWGFNDTCSLSGYFSTRQHIAELHPADRDGDYFSTWTCTGSHAGSIEAALAGEIDGAAIDSNVLATCRRERPELADQLRVVESWGPFPIQPVVVRAGLAALAGDIARSLLRLTDSRARAALERLGVQCFRPVGEELYEEERRALQRLGNLSTDTLSC